MNLGIMERIERVQEDLQEENQNKNLVLNWSSKTKLNVNVSERTKIKRKRYHLDYLTSCRCIAMFITSFSSLYLICKTFLSLNLSL